MSTREQFEMASYLGDIGELVVYEYLKSLKNYSSIIDVSGDKHYQKLDVDIVVNALDGKKCWVEAKYDSFTDGDKDLGIEPTGNIVFETKCNGKEGCLARSKADVVFIVTSKNIYYFNLDEIKEYFEIIKPKEVPMGDNKKSMGYVLSVKELMDARKLFWVKERNDRYMGRN